MSSARRVHPAHVRHGWWLAYAIFSVALAVTFGVVTSGCRGDDCSTAIAGGPIGWVAIVALLGQAAWAVMRAFRP